MQKQVFRQHVNVIPEQRSRSGVQTRLMGYIKMKFVRMTAVAISLVACATVNADAYLGAGLGYTRIDGSNYGISFDGSDHGYKLFGGYRWNDYFGMELAYYDYGEPDDDVHGVDIDIELDGFGGFAVGYYPLHDRFDLMARLGYIRYDIQARAAGSSASNDDDAVAWGVGGDYKLNSRFSIAGEWERLGLNDGNADMISISGRFHF